MNAADVVTVCCAPVLAAGTLLAGIGTVRNHRRIADIGGQLETPGEKSVGVQTSETHDDVAQLKTDLQQTNRRLARHLLWAARAGRMMGMDPEMPEHEE